MTHFTAIHNWSIEDSSASFQVFSFFLEYCFENEEVWKVLDTVSIWSSRSQSYDISCNDDYILKGSKQVRMMIVAQFSQLDLACESMTSGRTLFQFLLLLGRRFKSQRMLPGDKWQGRRQASTALFCGRHAKLSTTLVVECVKTSWYFGFITGWEPKRLSWRNCCRQVSIEMLLKRAQNVLIVL